MNKTGTRVIDSMIIYHSLNMSEFVSYVTLDKVEIHSLFQAWIKYSLHSKNNKTAVWTGNYKNLSRAGRSYSAAGNVRRNVEFNPNDFPDTLTIIFINIRIVCKR